MAYYNANIYKDYWNTNLANTSAKKLYSNYIYNYKNNVISPTQPQYNTGHPVIETGYRNYRKKAQPESHLFDYNDPFEINSFADAILTTFNKDMKRGNWGGLEDIPLLNIFTSLGDVLIEGTIKPLFNGEFSSVALNTLVNFSETMDILANPVKAVLKGGNPIDAMGWGENGRVNHDFDIKTGNGFTDFVVNSAAEMLVDPLNWITFGAKTIAKSTVDATATAIKELGGDIITDDAMIRKLAKKATKAYLQNDYDTMNKALKKIAPVYIKENLTEIDALKFMTNILEASTEIPTNNILKSAKTLYNISEGTQGLLLKGVGYTSGIIPAWRAVKGAADIISEKNNNRITQVKKPYNIDPSDNNSHLNVYKFEEFQEAFNERMLINNIADDDYISAEYARYIMQDGMDNALYQLNKLIVEYGDDPIKLDKAIRELFDISDDVPDAVAALFNKFELIDVKTKGAFTESIARARGLIDDVIALREVAIVKAQNELIDKTIKFSEQTHEAINVLLDTFSDSKSMQNLVDILRNKNFLMSDETLAKRMSLPGVTAIPKNVSKVEYVRHEIQEFHFMLRDGIDSLKILDNPLLEPVIRELNNTWNYFNLALTTSKTEVKKLNKYIKLMQESFSRVENFDLASVTLIYKSKAPKEHVLAMIPKDLGLNKRLAKAQGQGLLLDNLDKAGVRVKSFIKEASAEYKVAVKSINDGKAEIQELFESEKIQRIIKNVLDNMNDYDREIRQNNLLDAYNRFINTAPFIQLDDTSIIASKEYAEAWNDFSRELNETLSMFTKDDYYVPPTLKGTVVRDVPKASVLSAEELNTRAIDNLIKDNFRLNDLKGKDDELYNIVSQIKKTTHNLRNIEDKQKAIIKKISTLSDKEDIIKEDLNNILQDLGKQYETEKALKNNLYKAAFEHTQNKTITERYKQPFETNGTIDKPVKLKNNAKTYDDNIDLKEISKLLEKASPTSVKSRYTIELKEGMIVRQLKLEQLYKSLQLTDISEVTQLADDILNNTSHTVGAYIRYFSELEDSVALPDDQRILISISKIIRSQLEQQNNYKSFVETVLRNPSIRDEIKWALLSSLEHKARLDPRIFLDNFKRNLEDIFKSEELQTYAKEQHIKLDMESWLDADNGAMRKFVTSKAPKGSEHQALWDSVAEKWRIRQELAEHFSDKSKNYIVIDIETTASNIQQLDVTEIGFVSLYDDTDMGTLLRGKTDKVPSQKVLDVLYKYREDAPKDYDGRVALFLKENKDGLDQKTLLESFVAKLMENPNTELIAFNGEEFDFKTLIDKMRALNCNPQYIRYLEQMPKHDALKILREKNGIIKMTHEEKYTFERLLREYVENQVKIVDNYEKLIDTKDMVKKQGLKKPNVKVDRIEQLDFKKKKVYKPQLISTSSRDLANNLNEMSEILHLMGKAQNNKSSLPNIAMESIGLETYSKDLKLASAAVHEKLDSLMSTERQLGGYLLTDDAINTPEAKQFYQDMVNKYYDYLTNVHKGDANKLKEIEFKRSKALHRGTGDLNMSQFLYGIEPDAPIAGFRNYIVEREISEWFKLPPGPYGNPVLPEKTLGTLTKIGKGLTRTSESIKNPNRLKGLEEELSDWIRFILDPGNATKIDPSYKNTISLGKGTIINPAKANLTVKNVGIITEQDIALFSEAYKLLRVDKQDSISNYAILSMLYNSLSNRGLMPELLKQKNMSPELKALLDNPDTLKKVEFMDNVNRSLNKWENDPIHQLVTIRNELSNIADLDKYSKSLDDNGLFRAKAQAINAAPKPVQDMLEYGINKYKTLPTAESIKYSSNLYKGTNNLQINKAHMIMSLPVEELFKSMVHSGPIKIIGYKDLDPRIVREFAKKDFKSYGLELIEDNGVFYVIFKDYDKVTNYVDSTTGKLIYKFNGKEVEKPILNELDLKGAFKDLDDDVMVDHFIKSKQSLNEYTSGNSVGTVGDYIDYKNYEMLIKNLPEKVRNKLPDVSIIMNTDMFKELRFNSIVLGDMSFIQSNLPYASSSIIDTLVGSHKRAVVEMRSMDQYTRAYFNSGMDINTGPLSKLSDEVISQQLEAHPEYVLAALVEDKKNGYRVIRLQTKSAEQVALARSLNPIIVPYNTYSKMVESINYNYMSEQQLKFWNKVLYTYKMGFLLDPGVFLRNYIDSTIKNAAATDEIAMTVVNEQLYAAKLLMEYNNIVEVVIKSDVNNIFTTENLNAYFKAHPESMGLELFKTVDTFLKDGPSAGLTSSWVKYYLERDGVEGIWNTFVNTTSKLMTPNTQIEQINRLAEYLILTKRGMTNTEAFYKIAKTHFDYNLKTEGEKLIELLIPFYTFTMRNLEFWGEMLSKKPHLATLISDIMTPAWNFDSYSYEEYSRNQSLQYQILSGNIPISDNGMTLKLSPSFMDAFNLLANPIESVQSKIFQPYTELPKAIKGTVSGEQGVGTIINQLPIIGTLKQRYVDQASKYYERTGNILNAVLPGVFGATKRWQEFPKKNYPKKNYNYKKYNSSYSGRSSSRKHYNKYNKYITTRSYFSNYYPGRDFAPKKYWTPLMKGMPRGYNVNTNTSKNYSNGSFYRKHYTKTGRSRLKARMIPVTGYTLKYRIKDYSRYSR